MNGNEPTQDTVQVIAKAEDGKTLRDEFAMAALTGLLSNTRCDIERFNINDSLDEITYLAQHIANAAMKARQQ